MTLVSTFAAARLGAYRYSTALAVSMIATIAAVAPAAAQQSEPGPYAVARAGVQVDSDVKTNRVLAKGQTVSKTAPTLPKNIDNNSGFTGELGLGYDFGGFRLEGTAGYDTASVNPKALGDKNYVAGGRAKSFDLGVSAYVDLIQDGPLKPFVGGGIGASRVKYSAYREARSANPGTLKPSADIVGTDWGFRWHLDAGVSYDVAPMTSIEVLGRYAKTSGLRMKGVTLDQDLSRSTTDYKLKSSSTSLMIGLRQKF
ncbi:opacity protein-like surface antigen [Sphingomonas sp. SORGH_AS 950]|uniref:outer membrane protein n=1 Tax=unclassified Sphingomonas TaxID=196159 RepID=UPI00278654DC|nr:outer membrane beta-barrel protein [Sphingomonas sp. SORGH_AS_0950]MDQ1157573.1 opacity protein-like surface antigen [Sphingomonas sp. SORGH_AS_0950]